VLLATGRIAAPGAPAEVLTAARLATVYRIEALTGRHDGADYVLPWKRVPPR
jgi:iron complex transport system ATP-binding protein